MKSLVISNLIFLAVHFSNSAAAQVNVIPSDSIYQSYIFGFRILQDSIIKEYDWPLIEVNRNKIIFTYASCNYCSGELRLSGRICSDSKGCFGRSMEIFKGIRTENNILKSFDYVGRTKETDIVENMGYFDIKIKLKKEESLFFYIRHYYIEEFALGKIFGK